MPILSDTPDLVLSEFGLTAQPTQVDQLPANEAAAWRALAPENSPLFVTNTPSDQSDPLFVFVDHAHRSQFDALRDALASGTELPPVLTALARTGTGFHGNRQRPWATVPGNLHLTTIIRRPLEIARVGAALSMLPVVAVAELLGKLLPGLHSPEIKWVNDVLLGGRKVSGVLTATNIQGSTIEAAIFGIGLNIGGIPELPPTAFVQSATRLADWTDGPPPPLGTLTRELVSRLEAGLADIAENGPAQILASYRRLAGGIGRQVTIWPDDADQRLDSEPIARGRLIGINDDLTLRLEGINAPVTRGRLAYEPGEDSASR